VAIPPAEPPINSPNLETNEIATSLVFVRSVTPLLIEIKPIKIALSRLLGYSTNCSVAKPATAFANEAYTV
jgi:hypothetical protein